jgi:SAM-dependent methyltransferase
VDAIVKHSKIDAQYADPAKLTARQSLWQYLSGPPLPARVVDLVPPGATVADVGCGNGVYLQRLRRRRGNPIVVGFDLSAGMARAASVHAPTAVADAQALPLRDGSVDVVLCLHMLYHVPDIALAVRELRRVLRPGGLALITTNGAGHTAELKAVMDDAARWVAGTGVDPDWDLRRFDTDSAKAMLAEVFDDVAVVPAGGASLVTYPGIIIDYLQSWPPSAAGVEDGPMWTEVLREASRTVLAHFAQSPTFTVTSTAAILMARVPEVAPPPVKSQPAIRPARPGTAPTG